MVFNVTFELLRGGLFFWWSKPYNHDHDGPPEYLISRSFIEEYI